MQNLGALSPDVYAVVFNSSAYYQAQFNATLHFQNDVRYDRHYYVPSRSNRYGTPIFKEMILFLERTVDAAFYGYCNGDLLFEDSLVPLLSAIQDRIRKGELLPQVLCPSVV